MTIVERKKLFFDVLDVALNEKGFKSFKTGGDPTYVFKNDKLVISFFFNFFNAGDIGGGMICLTHNEIEDHILTIQFPDQDFKNLLVKDRYFLSTVSDRQVRNCIKKYLGTSSDAGADIAEKTIMVLTTSEEVILYANCFLKYFENEGADFIKKYSQLPNILTEMDRLESTGKYWNEILAGGPEHLFRGILISRFCNDSNYLAKVKWVDNVFSSMEEWQPYWEKLKAILPTIEAKYNV